MSELHRTLGQDGSGHVGGFRYGPRSLGYCKLIRSSELGMG